MKKLISILALVMGASVFAADAANDVLINQRNSANDDNVQRNVTATANALFVFNGSLVPVSTLTPSVTSLTLSSLTSGRVTFAGASGLLTDDADLTFATDTLTATKGTLGGITHVAGAITAGTTTDLTLSGGSSGASLVLGQGASGTVSITAPGGIVGTTAGIVRVQSTLGAFQIYKDGTPTKAARFTYNTTLLNAASLETYNGSAWLGQLTLTDNGNVLVNTTSDPSSLTGGLVLNGSGAGATASSTTTGTLRVTGGAGFTGAGYFGGALNAPTLTGVASTDLTINGGSGTSNIVMTASGAGGNVYARPGASAYLRVDSGLGLRVESGTLNVTTTTEATTGGAGSLTLAGGLYAAKQVVSAGNLLATAGLGLGVTSTATAAGTTTLTSASKAVQIFTGSTTQNITLPAANLFGAGVGVTYFIKNRSSGTLTVNRAGADTIDGATSTTVVSGAAIILISDGVSEWVIN